MRAGSRMFLAIVLSFFFYCNINAADVSALKDSLASVSTSEHISGQILPSPLMVIPFVVLLLMIATGPLFYKHF